MLAADDVPLDQARSLQDENVFRDGIQGDREWRCDFADRGGLARETSQNGAPGRVGNGRKYPVQGLATIFNHVVEYTPGGSWPSSQECKIAARESLCQTGTWNDE